MQRFPFTLPFPLRLIIILQEDAENYAGKKAADQCRLTGMDLNRPPFKLVALQFLTHV